MKVVVLLAGVEDPKWPVMPEGVLGEASEHRIMSPFDEAALEMALRLRDADPSVSIAARITGGAAATRIARAVAALNVSDVATLTVATPWDQAALARSLAPYCAAADLVLIGREFGDCDDGLVPPLLAELLEVPFFGRVQAIETEGGAAFIRETASESERLQLSGRLLVSATNDRRTRLRKPLMKNVMMARQATIAELGCHGGVSSILALEGVMPRASGRDRTDCVMLPGTLSDQAKALADLLLETRA